MKFIQTHQKQKSLPDGHWLLRLASFPRLETERHSGEEEPLDPQRGWYALNSTISEFLKSVPEERQLTVRGEDLLTDSEKSMRSITGWIGVRSDAEAIAEMMHPERSPFACYGPPSARYGNDLLFLEEPRLRPARAKVQSLEGPLGWRPDNREFLPDVKELARRFGYE